jgi:nucleoside-triphosphatase THEP1
MPEDVFRIVVTAAVALAAIAFIVQAALMTGLYRAVRKMEERIGSLAAGIQAMVEKTAPVIEKMGPVVDKIGPVIDKIGPLVARADRVIETAQLILDENRPKVAEITGEAARVVKSGRRQVELVSELLDDAGARAHARLEQIDRSVDGAIEQVELVGNAVKRVVTRPAREFSGISAGIAAALSALMHGRKYPVDRTTQDEEMFI